MDQFFKCKASDDTGYCNYSLLFHVIFSNFFLIPIHLYCLHGMLVKMKTLFYIKVFLLTNQRNICSFHHIGKIPTQKLKNSCIKI